MNKTKNLMILIKAIYVALLFCIFKNFVAVISMLIVSFLAINIINRNE